MKLFHLSDLHIGKSINGFSMEEDQKHILNQILNHINVEKPDAIIISGDIYDKNMPSNKAVQIFDDFLTALSTKNIPVFCISGNHDSAERLSFASRIMKTQNIYIEGVFNGVIDAICLQDKYGEVYFHLLPFIRPVNVRTCYKNEKLENYADAIHAVLEHNPINKDKRNILVAHQFVLPIQGDIERSESEIEPVGTVNAISASLFYDFDYVALGHIHSPQQVGKEFIRYAGSPLKYSFSEVNHQKSISVIELKQKGTFALSKIPLKPLHDMRKIKGPFAELISHDILQQTNTQDYMHITLTDENELIDAIGKLRQYYPNTMELVFENTRTKNQINISETIDMQNKSSIQLFQDFYKEQNGQDLTDEQKIIVADLLKKMEQKV